jgi:hypothetical protein
MSDINRRLRQVGLLGDPKRKHAESLCIEVNGPSWDGDHGVNDG